MYDDVCSQENVAPADPRRAWLASILMRSQRSWFGRFALQLRHMAALRRGQRRRLERKAAVSLAGAALVLSLGAGMMRPSAVHAASLTVDNGVVAIANDGDCSLLEAILNANSDSQLYAAAGECAAGSGADTINLPAAGLFTLPTYYGNVYGGYTGLPPVTSEIIIEGNGSTIERDEVGGAPDFRIMAVGASGDLTLKSATVRYGKLGNYGGGIYNAGYTLVQDSTLTGNFAYGGGALANMGAGSTVIDNSIVEYNEAGDGGGVVTYSSGTLTIQNGTQVRYNDAGRGGGVAALDSGLVTVDNSSINDNDAQSYGGGIFTSNTEVHIQSGATINRNEAAYYYGGGIYARATTVMVTDSAISGNSANEEGGGLHLNGTQTTIERSTVSENYTVKPFFSVLGGGIANKSFGATYSQLDVIDSTISLNRSVTGGGIYNGPGNTATVMSSTIVGNYASSNGGGIYNDSGMLSVINSTISGNSAFSGGGIASLGSYGDPAFAGSIVLSTLTGNTANYVGGLWMPQGTHRVLGSIISGNTGTGGTDDLEIWLYTTLTSDRNVLGDDSKTSAQAFAYFTPSGTDIVATSDGTLPTALAAILNTTLAANGGPTMTHALVSGSPALDYVPDAFCDAASAYGDLSLDQRGYTRNVDGNGGASANECDVGAFEYLGQPPLPASFCPVDPAVGYELTDLLGTGQGSKTKGYRTRKLVIPHPDDVVALYGQLAAVDVGTMKYVRFLPEGYPKIQIHPPTSPAYRPYAVDWWGTDLPTDIAWVKGQFFWGAKANKAPRAFVVWPTYDTGADEYANVFKTFDDSSTNHVAWETGFIPTQTQTIAIPETQAAGATVVVRVAVVDNDKDNRPIFLDVTVGSQTQSNADLIPNNTETLNLYEFTFEDVEAGVNEVTIRLESPDPDLVYLDGGDSAAMIGAAISYECTPEP